MRNALARTILGALMVSLYQPPEAAAGGPGLPGSELDATVLADEGTIWTYEYRIRNGGTENLPISYLRIDIRREKNTIPLPSEGLTLFLRNELTFDQNADMVLWEPPSAVVPVGCSGPEGWRCSLANPARLAFFARGPARVFPGQSVSGLRMFSRGLPTVRAAILEPTLVFYAEGSSANEEDTLRARGIHAAAIANFQTIGPSAPPLVFDAALFLDRILDQAAIAEQVGWLRGPIEGESVAARLSTIRGVIASGSLGSARALADRFVDLVNQNGCASFDCPATTALTAEARALLAINVAYLRDQLPANTPPVADAGGDIILTCSTSAETPVTLSGSGSSDAEGDALTYRWTGPFGEVEGESPTVPLPLGRSQISLVVRDGEFESEPDQLDVVVALSVAGFDPPAGPLVMEATEAPLPGRAYQRGRTIPLKLSMMCENGPATRVRAPEIASIARSAEPVDLESVDVDAGDSAEQGTLFRANGDSWIFNLSTAQLDAGVYDIRILLPDGTTHHAWVALR